MPVDLINIIHDESEVIRNNKYTSCILVLKSVSTFPYYFFAILEPSYILSHGWLLFMEAFYHFHTRIFYLLALYRSMYQLYMAFFTNGYYQRQYMMFEVGFDVSLIVLYMHEYFIRNIRMFATSFLYIHVFLAIISVISIYATKNMKSVHII